MPTVAYPGTLRVVCHQSFYGDESVNVFHVCTDETLPLSAPEAAQIDSAFLAMYQLFTSGTFPAVGFGSMRHPLAILDMIRVYDLSVVPNPPPHEFPHSVAGAAAHTVAPLECCATVTMRTANGTRRGRGRNYIGPLGGAAYEVSTATLPPKLASGATGMTGLAEAFRALNVNLQALSLLNNARLGVLSVADGVCREITSVRIDTRPDTQRRRDLSVPFSGTVNLDI